MKEVVLKGGSVQVIQNGVVVERYALGSRLKVKKPRPSRGAFENLNEDDQLEMTFFRQNFDQIDLIVSARRARNPKRIDHTVLPVG